jgi:fatty acid desaturase
MIDTGQHTKYVDHPAPSIALVVLLLGTMGAVIAALPDLSSREWLPLLLWILTLLLIGFYFWPFYSTYYTARAFLRRIGEFAPHLTKETKA